MLQKWTDRKVTRQRIKGPKGHRVAIMGDDKLKKKQNKKTKEKEIDRQVEAAESPDG